MGLREPDLPFSPKVQRPQVGLDMLPSEVHCPVCGEKVEKEDLSMAGATVAGAVKSAKVVCTSCGMAGVFSLRRTEENYVMYDLTFYVYPSQPGMDVLSRKELRQWARKGGLP